ncbi:protein kinase [Bacillus sp. ISL-75]|uniref:protein kinase domain-containing protein n=1 Tax=Bacillus sp. ISL-75 TaxID=2819137 RepID=UPI001BE8DD83|nr:protein kinase [Bacillus sp. ISL-75]MBT2727475.1 protein kinase [Bacillus sp. ISL-75]
MNSTIDLYQDTYLKERNIRLIREIEGGSTSSTYEGYHENFGKKLFVKFIPVPWQEGENIDDEVKALISLKGKKNIIEVLDAFYDAATDSQLVIITEYLEGDTLDKYCGLQNVSIKRAIDITMEALYAVGQIHSNGLVHRDIKLENIVYNRNVPIVVDLGSVKTPNSKVKIDDPIPYLYRSSEVFTKSIYSIRSDLYQLGLVLFQLINGKLPLDPMFYATRLKGNYEVGELDKVANMEVMKLVTKNKLIGTIEHNPFFCSKIKRVVHNALTLRYQSSDAFYKDLTTLKASIPDWYQSDDVTYHCSWNKKKYEVVKENGGFKIYKVGMVRKKELHFEKTGEAVNRFIQKIK